MSALIRQMVARKRQTKADAEAFEKRREQIVDAARGEKGPQGEIGPMPDHQWKGTKLRFEKRDGGWGDFVDLKGDPGKDAKDGQRVVVVGGASRPGLDTLGPGASGVTPAGIAVLQGDQWVNLPWDAFLSVIVGAVDMGSALSRRTDFVGSDMLYRGEAHPGAAESAPVWRIVRIEFLPDGDVIEKWAGGAAEFANAWADRATLSYQ